MREALPDAARSIPRGLLRQALRHRLVQQLYHLLLRLGGGGLLAFAEDGLLLAEDLLLPAKLGLLGGQGRLSIGDVKQFLASEGIPVR